MRLNTLFGHIFFWLAILIIGTATVYPYFGDINKAFINRAIFLPVWFIAAYANWWILMPRFFDKEKLKIYIGLFLGMIFILTIVQRYIFSAFFHYLYGWHQLEIFQLSGFIQFAAFIALPALCSTGIHLLRRWYQENYTARQIIAQQKTAELDYLKAQINPHFLFNTLNTLYGLSLEGSKKVPDLILKLSDILSYSLYESNVEKVKLSKEVQLIEYFIALERERYEGRMKVDFDKSAGLDPSIEITPLLLIPLVENAFKHGVKESTETVPIHIQLRQEEETLIFKVKNKISWIRTAEKRGKSGLGLSNLRRRLDLVYPQKYTLVNKQIDEYYYAELKILLNE